MQVWELVHESIEQEPALAPAVKSHFWFSLLLTATWGYCCLHLRRIWMRSAGRRKIWKN